MREYRPKTKHEKAVDAQWSRIFSKKMNQLTIAAGLRVDFGNGG